MNDFNRQNDEFWRWGIIYFNPGDPSIWIEKRIGIGWTKWRYDFASEFCADEELHL